MSMRFRLIGLGALLLLAVACVDRFDTPEDGRLVPVQLALSVRDLNPVTKAVHIPELLASPAFRGVDSIRILAFANTGSVSASDQTIGYPRRLPSISTSSDQKAWSGEGNYHSGLISGSNAHLYPDVSAALPVGTASVLVYGQAPHSNSTAKISDQEDKRQYGSLIAEGWASHEENMSVSTIHFVPDPIYTTTTQATAERIAYILTYIASASSETDSWSNTSDNTLKDLFLQFTGEGRPVNGSSRSLANRLTLVYQAVRSKDSDLRTAIAERFEYLDDDLLISDGKVSLAGANQDDYPISQGLPEGSASFRWNGTRFVAITQQGFDGVAAMDRFCYIPSLYYFTNTTIQTSSDIDIYKQFDAAEGKNWGTILGKYTNGTMVTLATNAVALVKPLEYAGCRLVIKVRANADKLSDRNDYQLDCGSATKFFPVTGIIVNAQFTQCFDFTPDTDSREFNLYDNDLYDDNTKPEIFLRHTDSADGLTTLQTLVLPTPVNRNVHYCLEFLNNSDQSFTGADGVIPAGSHFYLVGKLSASEASASGGQVFKQGYSTSVNCLVKTLKNAYLCIPELGNPGIQLGVQTQVDWIMSHPAQISLE